MLPTDILCPGKGGSPHRRRTVPGSLLRWVHAGKAAEPGGSGGRLGSGGVVPLAVAGFTSNGGNGGTTGVGGTKGRAERVPGARSARAATRPGARGARGPVPAAHGPGHPRRPRPDARAPSRRAGVRRWRSDRANVGAGDGSGHVTGRSRRGVARFPRYRYERRAVRARCRRSGPTPPVRCITAARPS